VAGAEKLNEEVRNTYTHKFGIRILEGYGVTECAPVLAVNTPMANKSGSVGTLIPGLEAKLEPVPGITEGALLSVRGPNVMLGYYLFDNPGVIAATADGWHSTGDIVSIDDEGFLFIKGRVKRFAKLPEKWYHWNVQRRLPTMLLRSMSTQPVHKRMQDAAKILCYSRPISI